MELFWKEKTLSYYRRNTVHPIGNFECEVKLNHQTEVLNLFVLNNGGRPLFGREWLSLLNVKWTALKALHVSTGQFSRQSEINNLKSKYAEVFSDELGKLKDKKGKLILKENSSPKFMKARPVPYSLKDKIDKELDKLIDQGVIEKVSTSKRATPVVPVPRANGDLRLCGDYKATVNPVLEIEQYPFHGLTIYLHHYLVNSTSLK